MRVSMVDMELGSKIEVGNSDSPPWRAIEGSGQAAEDAASR